MTLPLVYLASPYSHDDPAVRELRYQAAMDMVAAAMKSGRVALYSPIVHSHQIAIKHELPKGWDFWRAQDEAMIPRCDKVFVLTMDGWTESKGVSAEIEIARSLGIPVEYIHSEKVFA